MFEQFGSALYKAGAYELDVAVPKKVYILTHVDALSREKWSKVQFKVDVDVDRTFFNCECGIFEHSGMVCCHALKVNVISCHVNRAIVVPMSKIVFVSAGYDRAQVEQDTRKAHIEAMDKGCP